MVYSKNDIEYKIAKQNNRILHSQIFILNFKMQKVEEISGYVLDGANFSIDATSDIRRTCNISIVPTSSSFDIAEGSNIWIDKYVQIYIGIEDNSDDGKIIYTNMGIYMINNPSRTYSSQTNTITITGIDLMARMTGMRNGYLTGSADGSQYQIPRNSKIRNALISIVKDLGGFKKYVVETPSPTPKVPNDINASVGSTQYELLKQLSDINSNYQTYFDVNGVFNFNKIPSGKDEPIRVDDDLWKDVLIDYTSNISFEEVKNVIEVYGKTLDDGTTPYAKVEETNPNSPFYVNGTAGRLNIVLSGGEYDNIQTTELAEQRARYELYLRCRLQDQVTIKTVPIYWLDVNWLISITLPNKQGSKSTELYIIKKITTTLGKDGTQSITMMKYYPTELYR